MTTLKTDMHPPRRPGALPGAPRMVEKYIHPSNTNINPLLLSPKLSPRTIDRTPNPRRQPRCGLTSSSSHVQSRSPISSS